uniref:HHO5-like N-terminal domain-containing protein n=1 Tax=Oryza barthii TaxID=65489 RepID=A0A0D3EK90_9ORYZ
MASSSSDLTLDDHHHLTAVAAASGQATQKLQEFLSRLEEERLKIDAFKRELPLCMQLLNHAMEAYRQQLEAYQMGSQHGAAAAAAARAPLVLEEFIPVKNIGIDVVAADKAAAAAAAAGGNSVSSEKASWMLRIVKSQQ